MVVGNLQFYREESLKRVEINGFRFEIPREWEVVRLKDGEYFQIVQGENYSTKELKEKGYPVFGANGIIGYGKKFHYKKSVVVVTCRGSTCGSVNLTLPFSFVTHNAMAILPIEKKIKVDTKYLYYALLNTDFRSAISGTGQPQITKTSIAIIKFPLPPLPEQQKIAQVLTSIDKAIEEVDKAIAKAERIKKGLMQELLTKGIGHEEFKDTEIGRIPKEWEVVRLGNIADFKNGINFKKDQKGNEGVLTIDVLNMYGHRIEVNLTNLYRVKLNLEKNFEYLLKKGDILFVRSSLKREGSAWAALFSGYHEPVTFCGFIIRARLKRKEILPEFLTYYLRMEKVRNRLISSSGQVTISNISQENLKSLYIPLPSLEEQKKIAELLLKWDEIIELKKAKKEKLEKMKKKIMELLLTGKVRVK